MSKKTATDKLIAQVDMGLIDSFADGVLIVDDEGKVLYENAAAIGLLGRADGTLVGEVFGQVLAGEKGVELDLLVDRRARVVELRSAETQWKEQPATLVMLRDVTAQHEQEQALREARNAADLANRLTSALLESFSAELTEPVRSILGSARLINAEQGKYGLENARAYARKIMESGQYLLETINTIMKLAEFQSTGIELVEAPMELAATISLCLPAQKREAEKRGISIEADLDGTGLSVETDRLRFLQVVNLLMACATNLCAEGSNIVLQLLPGEEAAADVNVAFSNPALLQETSKLLKMPFFRLDGETRPACGTGLELPLADVILKALGTSLDIDIDDEGSARLRFSLPVVAG